MTLDETIAALTDLQSQMRKQGLKTDVLLVFYDSDLREPVRSH